jgi:hypothetical protein
MSNAGFGQGPKRETVYGGPALEVKQAPVNNRPTIPAGTGTVYNGTAPGSTVYSGTAQPAAAPPMPRAYAVALTSAGAKKGAAIFYLIAGFTAANMILMFVGVRFAVGLGSTNGLGADMKTLAVANLLAIGIFVLLGIFAQRGSKAAFVIGMLLYGGDLVVLAMNNPALHIVSIVIHGFFLWRLVEAFRELPE